MIHHRWVDPATCHCTKSYYKYQKKLIMMLVCARPFSASTLGVPGAAANHAQPPAAQDLVDSIDNVVHKCSGWWSSMGVLEPALTPILMQPLVYIDCLVF